MPFGAYAYGHSMLDWSTSAYGYTISFKGNNDALTLTNADQLSFTYDRLRPHTVGYALVQRIIVIIIIITSFCRRQTHIANITKA